MASELLSLLSSFPLVPTFAIPLCLNVLAEGLSPSISLLFLGRDKYIAVAIFTIVQAILTGSGVL